MAEPFIGEIRVFSFPKTPQGWLPCDGRTMQIQSNQALYTLLGTKFGGNGTTTFNLPDYRGRAMMGYSVYGQPNPNNPNPNFLSFNNIGMAGGSETVTLTQNQIQMHNHQMMADNISAGFNLNAAAPPEILASPVLNTLANAPVSLFNNSTNLTTLNSGSVSPAGDSAPHENRMPFVTLNVCIATVGYYPPRN